MTAKYGASELLYGRRRQGSGPSLHIPRPTVHQLTNRLTQLLRAQYLERFDCPYQEQTRNRYGNEELVQLINIVSGGRVNLLLGSRGDCFALAALKVEEPSDNHDDLKGLIDHLRPIAGEVGLNLLIYPCDGKEALDLYDKGSVIDLVEPLPAKQGKEPDQQLETIFTDALDQELIDNEHYNYLHDLCRANEDEKANMLETLAEDHLGRAVIDAQRQLFVVEKITDNR